jgi:hypothetical protein
MIIVVLIQLNFCSNWYHTILIQSYNSFPTKLIPNYPKWLIFSTLLLSMESLSANHVVMAYHHILSLPTSSTTPQIFLQPAIHPILPLLAVPEDHSRLHKILHCVMPLSDMKLGVEPSSRMSFVKNATYMIAAQEQFHHKVVV